MRSEEEIREEIKHCELDLNNSTYQSDTKELIKQCKYALEWVLNEEKPKVIFLKKDINTPSPSDI